MTKEWESYEEVARYLIEQYREHFDLARVEGKQKIKGENTEWQVDCLGYTEDGAMVIIECKRWNKGKVTQETVGGLAHRISTTKSARGIIVSPHELQKGAKLEAAGNNITSIKLNANSTPEHYLLEFLKHHIYQGPAESITSTVSLVSITFTRVT